MTTLLVTFAFSYTNISTVVYFEPIPYTPHPLEHQICTNLQLKIVPNKCTIASCLSSVC